MQRYEKNGECPASISPARKNFDKCELPSIKRIYAWLTDNYTMINVTQKRISVKKKSNYACALLFGTPAGNRTLIKGLGNLYSIHWTTGAVVIALLCDCVIALLCDCVIALVWFKRHYLCFIVWREVSLMLRWRVCGGCCCQHHRRQCPLHAGLSLVNSRLQTHCQLSSPTDIGTCLSILMAIGFRDTYVLVEV